MSKKLIALLLALGMCFSLASCQDLLGNLGIGGSASESSSEESSESSSTDDGSSETPDNSGDETPDSGDGEQKKEYVTVTFKQVGKDDVVKTVEKGSALTDIPTPEAKTGYTVSWDKTDFSAVTGDMVVNAVETAKTYTVVFSAAGTKVDQSTITIAYGQEYELPVPMHEDKTFKNWTYGEGIVAMEGVWNIDSESGEVVLVATWSADWTGNY